MSEHQVLTKPLHRWMVEVGRHRPLNVGASNIAIMSTLPDAEIQHICIANQERVSKAYPNYAEVSALLHATIERIKADIAALEA